MIIFIFFLTFYFKDFLSLDCNPSSVIVTLGNYYEIMYSIPENERNLDEKYLFIITYQSIDYCQESSIKILYVGQELTIKRDSFNYIKTTQNGALIVLNIFKVQKKLINYIGVRVQYSIYPLANSSIKFNYSFFLPTQNSEIKHSLIFVGQLDTNNDASSLTINAISKILKNEEIDAVFYAGNTNQTSTENYAEYENYILKSMSPITSFAAFSSTPNYVDWMEPMEFFKKQFLFDNAGKVGEDFFTFSLGFVDIIQLNIMKYVLDPTLKERFFEYLYNEYKDVSFDTNYGKWAILYTYYPLYCSFEECKSLFENENAGLKELEPILYKLEIDLVISGKLPIYERIYPIYDYKKDSQVKNTSNITSSWYPIYIIEGVGGNNNNKIKDTKIHNTYSILTNYEAGYGKLTVENRTCIHYAHFSSKNNEIIDEFYLFKVSYRWSDEERNEFLTLTILYVFFGIALIVLFQFYVESKLIKKKR